MRGAGTETASLPRIRERQPERIRGFGGLVNDVFFLRIFPDRGNQFGIDTVFPMDILQELLTEFFSGEPDRDVRGCESGLTVACEDGGSQLIHINE